MQAHTGFGWRISASNDSTLNDTLNVYQLAKLISNANTKERDEGRIVFLSQLNLSEKTKKNQYLIYGS